MSATIDDLLHRAIDTEVSDVHILAGSTPRWRVNGDLVFVPEATPFETDSVLAFHASVHPNAAFNGDDFAFVFHGRSWRANASLTITGPKLTLRLIPSEIPAIESLGLPPQYIDELNRLEGLHLVTGRTSSGKTTTIASIIRHLAARHQKHIVTLEDPIEQRHSTELTALVVQRELGTHFSTFGDGVLRGILRQDPDVIVFGELRDRATVKAAITAAETGHMVIGTLHNKTATEAVSRMLDACADNEHEEHAALLSKTLTTVIAQRLVPTRDHKRVAAFEYMLMTPSCRNIVRQRNYHQLPDEVARGQAHGMQSMSAHLIKLCRSQRITRDAALAASPDPEAMLFSLPKL